MLKANVDVLIAIRLEQGLSQRQLAIKAMLSPSTISRIENGGPVPRPFTALKICGALERDFNEIFEEAEGG